MVRVLRLVRIVSLCLIFLLAGFYAGWWIDNRNPEPARPIAAAPAGQLIERLPDFALPDLTGDLRSIRDWSDRNMLINFWATWCAPCRREMPLLQTVHDELGAEKLAVIGIAVDRQPDVETFVAESGVTYPILVGQQDAIEAAETFGPEFVGLPFSIVVARGGEVLAMHSGELHREQLRQMLAVVDSLDAGNLTLAAARERLADGQATL